MIRKILIICVLFLLAVTFLLYRIIQPIYSFTKSHLKISPQNILLGKESVKQHNNKVNILILGIAGGQHDGPLLTDSIIIAQYDLLTNTLNTVGLPRDIWSDNLRDKINSAYAYGEEKNPGSGLKLAKTEIGTIIGQPIQYGIVINFEKFTQLIDTLGGIDVLVEHSFTDPNFPIAGREYDECNYDGDYSCRYEALSFEQGLTKMDGKTALKFVRSRYSNDDEGTDFARSKRQQLVINGIKNKFISLFQQDLRNLSFDRISPIIDYLDMLVLRDISNTEVALLGKNVIMKRNFTQIQSQISSEWFEVPMYEEYEGRYVLIPRDNDYVPLHKNISCLLNKNCS